MWQTLKSVISPNSNKSRYSSISSIQFNDFFSKVGETLKQNLTDNDLPIHVYDNPEIDEVFNFYEININSVLKELLNLPNRRSLDVLDMENKLLRISAPVIAPFLTHIFNLSLYHGKIPSDFKLARVTPIFKGQGDTNDPNNYRAISVVSTVAKIFEKNVKTPLITHFENNNLMSAYQFAYLKNRSTQTALHQILDECMYNTDIGNLNMVCCLDLSKGFDTLSHEIILHQFKKYGITSTNLLWFQSYLSNRQQMIKFDSNISSVNYLNTGVPQGTVLGPIIFLIYVNDLTKINNTIPATIIMYADDTTLLCKGKTALELKSNTEASLRYVHQWFKSNRLIVNPNKSFVMPIASLYKVKTIPNEICIMLDDTRLMFCNEIKLLGIYIDQTLSFTAQVDYIRKKVCPKIGLIHRLRHFLSQDTLNTVYLTTIQPIFDYCLSVWGKVSVQNHQKLQKRCARAVTGIFDHDISSASLIKKFTLDEH